MNANEPATLTPSVLRGRAIGILACTAFAACWASAAASAATAALAGIGYAVIALISGALLLAGINVVRGARGQLSANDTPRAERRRIGRIFSAVFATEIVAINLAVYLSGDGHLAPYLTSIIAIIVGLHFYPLAPLFRTPQFHVTATLITLAGIAGIASLAGGTAATPANAIVALISAITLWATAFVCWRAASHPIGANHGHLPPVDAH